MPAPRAGDTQRHGRATSTGCPETWLAAAPRIFASFAVEPFPACGEVPAKPAPRAGDTQRHGRAMSTGCPLAGWWVDAPRIFPKSFARALSSQRRGAGDLLAPRAGDTQRHGRATSTGCPYAGWWVGNPVGDSTRHACSAPAFPELVLGEALREGGGVQLLHGPCSFPWLRSWRAPPHVPLTPFLLDLNFVGGVGSRIEVI